VLALTPVQAGFNRTDRNLQEAGGIAFAYLDGMNKVGFFQFLYTFHAKLIGHFKQDFFRYFLLRSHFKYSSFQEWREP